MNIPLFGGLKIDQVALIVEDLEQSISQYRALFGYGPWKCYTYNKSVVPVMNYRGRPTDTEWRIAMADIGEMNLELMECRRKGDNIFSEFIEEKGYGLHHVGVNVASTAAVCREAQSMGIKVLQEGMNFGLDGDGHFAYLDTAALIGMIVELREVPRRRAEPHQIL